MNVKVFGECQFMCLAVDDGKWAQDPRIPGKGSISAIWVAPKGQMAWMVFFYKAIVPTGHDQHIEFILLG
jgi:hypothetical protein